MPVIISSVRLVSVQPLPEQDYMFTWDIFDQNGVRRGSQSMAASAIPLLKATTIATLTNTVEKLNDEIYTSQYE